ncbi:NAD-dependent epimerase/dehydratase family protein [Candidatus Woesearchaeota archaeon]|nr:NAD-dependent epimerase/dehydratase family protein [Candidatus Woesearchaeota archaeon]
MKSRIIQEDIENIAKDIAADATAFSGKTVLITGGAGFLGNYFIGVFDFLNKNILDTPCKIISVDNFITGVRYNIEEDPNFRAIRHNIKDPLKINENVDYIIHAAGIASPKFYREFKIETIDVATLGTKNMLEIAKEKKIKSMLFFSSSEVYGDPDPNFIPTPETYFGNVSCIGPRSNYDESKRLGETLCIAYFETYSIPVKVVRPFNVFGPGMRLDDYRVIPNFVSNALRGKPIPVYGSGNNTRTFCYIKDAMTEFFKVLLSDYNGEAFNIGNENDEINMETLACIVAENFDSKPKIENIPGPNDAYASADPKRRCPNLTKMKTKLNYTPKVDLKAGVKRFIQWAKEKKI